MSKEENLEFKLPISPLVASSIVSLGSGTYVGYSHASGGDASLIAPAITTVIQALTSRNEANMRRNNPMQYNQENI